MLLQSSFSEESILSTPAAFNKARLCRVGTGYISNKKVFFIENHT